MTHLQKETIDALKNEYDKNCKEYLGYGGCSFSVYHNPDNPMDNNIVVVSNYVDGTSDDLQAYYSVAIILIEPDGNRIDMKQHFNQDDVEAYLKTLHKIETY
jgi:hypothetical protein